MKELWADIDGYEGSYKISSFGRLMSLSRSVKSGHKRGFRTTKDRITTYKLDGKYQRISLSKNGEQTTVSVHRLVARAFIPNQNNKPHVNHIDGNPSNNRVDNLEWCTAQENELRSYRVLGKKNSMRGTYNTGTHCIRVVDTKTGIVYSSVSEVERQLHINAHNLRRYLNGSRKNKTQFKYAD